MRRILLSLALLATSACYVQSNLGVGEPEPATPAGVSTVGSTATAGPAALPALPAGGACAVWTREVEFARSVQEHDAAAFAEHVHPGAVFVDAQGVAQGREAIVKGWASIVRGDGVHLAWHPTSVVLAGDSRVALSRGPYWLELAKPGEPVRYMTGVYQSVWSVDADGAWRVIVDGGTPPPKETTRDEVERIEAALPAKCPG
jgi:ketosteroid isomerase-like protein